MKLEFVTDDGVTHDSDNVVEVRVDGSIVSSTPASETVTVTPNTPLVTTSDGGMDAPADPPPAEPASPAPDGSASTEPAPDPSSSDTASTPDPAHDQAVTDAQTAVEVASAPTTPAEDKLQLVTDAQNDVAAALEQWPDSPALADLKAKLEQLAADLTA